MGTQNKIIIWCDGVDSMFLGEKNAAGIQVQMSMWASVFSQRGWSVYSFSRKINPADVNGIHFIRLCTSSLLSILHLQLINDFFNCLIVLFRVKPRLIICRGSSRNIFFIDLVAKMIGAKTIFFGASDLNFQIGKEPQRGSSFNTYLYRRGLRRINYFVTQNSFQYKTLQSNYGKESIVIPNIWNNVSQLNTFHKQFDVIWVSNLKPLKRAEWVINLAKKAKCFKVAIIGGRANNAYYESIESESKSIDNLYFGGPQPLDKTTRLIGESRVLLCTSTSEGFPNTFLQAWSQGIPVISTVDPSGVIEENKLGIYVSNEDELLHAVRELLNDKNCYLKCVNNISNYFQQYHSVENAYNNLIKYIGEDE